MRLLPLEVTETDEPTEDASPSLDPLDREDEGDSAAPPHAWLGAMGQMVAALFVVVALIAVFIGAAVAFRRLLP